LITHVCKDSIAVIVHAVAHAQGAPVNAAAGWALAVAAVVAGWFAWGWQGVALAVTVTVFWLLLQFSRALRVMRAAGGRPVGSVGSAVMLNARLRKGMRLMDIIRHSHSLGRAVSPPPDERFDWSDEGGSRVEVLLRGGRLVEWQLHRPILDSGDAGDAAAADAPQHRAAP
jgi:hypothetical protein